MIAHRRTATSAPARDQSDSLPAGASNRRVVSLVLLLALITLAVVWLLGRTANPGPLGLRLDDAWIHMVYGRGVAASGFLAYNDGIPSTGCTSPLWAVVLGVVHLVTASSSLEARLLLVFIIGAAAQVLVVWRAFTLSFRLTGSWSAAFVAGGLCALATPFVAAAFSGMEVTLTALLMLVGIEALVASRLGAAGLALALAALARPEAGVVLLVALTHVVYVAYESRRGAALNSSELGRVLCRLVWPSIVAGGLLAAHHWWASGSILPATYHAKASIAPLELPSRVARALLTVLTSVPPLQYGIGWLALVGYLEPRGGAVRSSERLPLVAGAAFLVAHLLVLDPGERDSFYDLRYLLPALPLILVALAVGAHKAGHLLPARWRMAPQAALFIVGLVGAAMTASTVSWRLHNDVRNINEVQRALGEWLGEHVPPDRWIAASDAGAVRYFSNRPTIDVLGLNTPEMLDFDEAFIRTHPVVAIALMPAWFRPTDPDMLAILYTVETERYTVTSNPAMASQIVVSVPPGRADRPVRVAFVGYRSFALDVAPLDEGRP